METYNVKYFYHAQGMDKPDERDHGEVFARTADEAVEQIINEHYPGVNEDSKTWLRSCLTATLQTPYEGELSLGDCHHSSTVEFDFEQKRLVIRTACASEPGAATISFEELGRITKYLLERV